jgi:copper/silver efflux system protein
LAKIENIGCSIPEVMQRIAVPMIGGMASSALLTLLVIPAIYGLVKGWRLSTTEAAWGNIPASPNASL